MDRSPANLGDIINTIQRDLDELKMAQANKIADSLYPIGSVITFYDSDDHSTHLGLTWERFAAGKMVVGYDSTDSDFNTIGATGGEKEHQLIADEMPSHSHAIYNVDTGSGGSGYGKQNGLYYNGGWWGNSTAAPNVKNTGGDQAHNNMPPYVVAALWRRIA